MVISRRRRMVDFAATAAVVLGCQAPPAMILLQLPHFQIPTLVRFKESFPQKAQVLGVLRNLIILHHLTEGSTISGSVLATDACFLCALSHLCVATVCPM